MDHHDRASAILASPQPLLLLRNCYAGTSVHIALRPSVFPHLWAFPHVPSMCIFVGPSECGSNIPGQCPSPAAPLFPWCAGPRLCLPPTCITGTQALSSLTSWTPEDGAELPVSLSWLSRKKNLLGLFFFFSPFNLVAECLQQI